MPFTKMEMPTQPGFPRVQETLEDSRLSSELPLPQEQRTSNKTKRQDQDLPRHNRRLGQTQQRVWPGGRGGALHGGGDGHAVLQVQPQPQEVLGTL